MVSGAKSSAQQPSLASLLAELQTLNIEEDKFDLPVTVHAGEDVC
jgi:hypothetical protein